FEVRLVDERRRLQRLPRPLAAEVVRGQAPQLRVDRGHQRLEVGTIGPGLGHQPSRWIVSLVIVTGVTGRSCRPVGTAPIFLTMSMPSTTSPKTEWRLSRCGVGPSVMKNWLPLVFGPAFAIDSIPALLWRALGWNSSAKL